MEKKHSIRKRLLIIFICIVFVCGVFAGVGTLARRAHAVTVKVIPVSDLNQASFFGDGSDSMLYGEISTSVTQKVSLIDDAIISQVYVKKGDHVNVGDPLLTYDMTLKQLELELARLQKQDLENKLIKAQERLESLKNGGPILDPSDDYIPIDDEDDDSAYGGGWLKAFARLPLDIAAAVSGQNASVVPEESEIPKEPEGTEDVVEPVLPVLYEVLDYDSQPYQGDGSKEFPYCFLCTSSEEGVVVKGSFFNKMAGYNQEGTKEEQSSSWYRLEFHENDHIGDAANPSQSLLGCYIRQGKEVMDPEEEKIFTLEGAGPSDDGETVLTPTPQAPGKGPNTKNEYEDDDDWEDDWDDWEDEEESSMTREEAIRYQENNIQAYKLDIQKKALSISKMEKLLEQETISSTIQGVVTVVGDPETGDSPGEGFIEIESDDGFYVKGSLGEMALEQVKVGDFISGFTYESGQKFSAEIREIAIFPAEGDQGYMGMGNPNESYYPFTAHVTEDLDMENGESAELSINTSQARDKNAIYLDNAMVRTEGGRYYVYKDEGGKLKKQFVTAQKSSDGYSTIVTKGLSNEDKIAFPYGSGVEEGAETKEGTTEDLYGY